MQDWQIAYDDLLPVVAEGETPTLRPSTFEAFRTWLIQHINGLIAKDFEALMFLLYRIDVNERIVKEQIAASKGEHAAAIIADLIIERQLKKIEWRKKFREAPPAQEDEDERW